MSGSDRRTFIKTIVLATGAVFTDWGVKAADAAQQPHAALSQNVASLRFKQPHAIFKEKTETFIAPPPRETTDVIVVGGGISGLTAAWMLKKNGLDVIVVENEPNAGGMSRKSIWGDVQADLGANRFSRNDDIYKTLFDDCGVEPITLPPDSYWFGIDAIIRDLWDETTLRSVPVTFTGADAFSKFRNFVLEYDPRPEFPLVKMNREYILQTDTDSASSLLGKFDAVNLMDWVDVWGVATFGQTLQNVSQYALLALIPPLFGPTYQGYTYSFAGGVNSLPEQLKKKIGARSVREQTLAVEVKNARNGVEVTTLDAAGAHTIRAGAAIVASQKMMAAHLVPELPGLQREKMRMLPYAPAVTVQFRCSAPLLTSRSFVTWFLDQERRFTNIFDMTYIRDMQSGQLNRTTGDFYYALQCSPIEIALPNMQHDDWLASFAQKTADALAEHVPGVYAKTKELCIFAWGHALATPKPAIYGVMYPDVQTPVKNIFFANSDNDVCSRIESAIFYGNRSAEAAFKALK